MRSAWISVFVFSSALALECAGSVSRACAGSVVTEVACGNGCNPETGQCVELRPLGTVCDAAPQCASGACDVDITGTSRCCDAACAAAGRACGTDGSCVCRADQEDVAGVCLSRNGVACAAGTDCASGVCAQTLASVGGASTCCATACPGASCSADGTTCVQCEGAGSECVGNTSRRCENGQLVEAACGNGCDPATGVCAGLLATGLECTAGAQCASGACDVDIGGTQRCCTPGCAASGRVCGLDGACVCPDPGDTFLAGQCRSPVGQGCAAAGDCSTGACERTQSGALVCCTAPCNGQICRASGQGCVQCEGGGPACDGSASRACVNNAFVVTPCANGCNPANGMCNSQLPLGSTGCSQDTQCAGAGSSCQSGRCCEFDCAAAGRTCDATGRCGCPAGTTLVAGACLAANGQPCDRARPEQCASSQCLQWFRDSDGDLHGDPGDSVTLCGAAPPSGFVASSDDCCDRDAQAHPDQTESFAERNGCDSFDYDCDGGITNTGQEHIGLAECEQIPLTECRGIIWASMGRPPRCGDTATFLGCGSAIMGVPLSVCTDITGGPMLNRCR